MDYKVTITTTDLLSLILEADSEFEEDEIDYEFSNGRQFETPDNPYA